jgi:hypothetical protein
VDQEILREEIKYEVTFAEDERFEGLLHLRIIGYDRSGFQLSELNRMINEH